MKKKTIGLIASASVTAIGVVAHLLRKQAEKTSYTAILMEPIEKRKQGFYEKCIKRGLDVACATGAIVCFSPVYLGIAALVKLNMGSPVLFTQDRPGLIGEDGKETIFKMYKFRTMTDETDEKGNLLPDYARLTKFGAWLRSTSLDELPETINILKGDMSIIGPRPQLVRDMVFMTEDYRHRHDVRPGLSGLAQTRGRNAISWDTKLQTDLEYISNISFFNDLKIVLLTITKTLKREGISAEGKATIDDYGDELIKNGIIDEEEYYKRQEIARLILQDYWNKRIK